MVDEFNQSKGFSEEAHQRLRVVYSRSVRRGVDVLRESEICLHPVGLPEPLKVRVITKGPNELTQILIGLQKFLAKQLARHRTFQLTGKPVDVETMQDVLGALPEGWKFLNGDYSAATNNMRSWFSRIYAEEISRHLDLSDDVSDLLLRGLVGNVIVTKDCVEKDGRLYNALPQGSGQPMGFNNSFVGLCLCNAVVAKIVWCVQTGSMKTITKQKLSEMPILINGDDLDMHATDCGYKAWQDIGAHVGLSPSQGKVYFTDEFAQINSRNFIYEGGVLRPTYLLNMGLLEGVAKKGGLVANMSRSQRVAQLATNYRDLMRDCLTLKQKAYIHEKFMHIHKEFLEGFQAPRFVPTWAGGLGFTGYLLPTVEERVRMRIIRLNHNDSRYRPRSLDDGEKEWLVREIAEKQIPGAEVVTCDADYAGVKAYERALGSKCVDILFDMSFDFHGGVFAGIKERKEVSDKNLRWNERLWRKLRRIHTSLAPLTYEEAVSVRFYKGYKVHLVTPFNEPEVIDPLPRLLVLGDEKPNLHVSRDD